MINSHLFCGGDDYFVQQPKGSQGEPGKPGDSDGYLQLVSNPNIPTEQIILMPFSYTLVLVAMFGVRESDIKIKIGTTYNELETAEFESLNLSKQIAMNQVAIIKIESPEPYGAATFKLVKIS